MAKDNVNVSSEEIAEVSGISVSVPSEDFSPEWESYSFMEKVKKSVASCIQTFENDTIPTGKNHVKETDEIAYTKQPVLQEISDEDENSDDVLKVGTVTTYSVRVRSGKGTKYDTISYLSENDQVEIINDDGSGWVKVKLSGDRTGYVSKKYLNIETKKGTTSSPSKSDEKVHLTTTVDTEKTGLNVRTGKGTEYDIITSLPKGSSVEVISIDKEKGWAKIKLSGDKTGYVSIKYLEYFKDK